MAQWRSPNTRPCTESCGSTSICVSRLARASLDSSRAIWFLSHASSVVVMSCTAAPSSRRSIGAYWADLLQGNTTTNLTLVAKSEFGRNVRENGNAGTDHGRGSAMLVLGGGILGGKVYGKWPGLADSALDHGDLAVTTDFRTVLGEIVLKRLGNPAIDQVFPGFTLQPLGLAVG